MHTRYYCFWHSAAVALTLAFAGGCDSPDEPEIGVEGGALALQCMFNDIEVDEVQYAVMRSGVPVRSGSFVARASTRDEEFSAVIGPLPSGDNYSIALKARALRVKSGDSSECTGDGSFSVAPRQTTVVAVVLRCGGIRERGPTDNACPSIDSVRAVPSEIAVGSTLSLRADAHDPDRKLGPLQFTWTTGDGMLVEAMQSRAGFVCTSPGRAAITLKITDGDDTCPEESVTVYVKCRNAPSNQGAGSFASGCMRLSPAAAAGAGHNGAAAAGSSPAHRCSGTAGKGP